MNCNTETDAAVLHLTCNAGMDSSSMGVGLVLRLHSFCADYNFLHSVAASSGVAKSGVTSTTKRMICTTGSRTLDGHAYCMTGTCYLLSHAVPQLKVCMAHPLWPWPCLCLWLPEGGRGREGACCSSDNQ